MSSFEHILARMKSRKFWIVFTLKMACCIEIPKSRDSFHVDYLYKTPETVVIVLLALCSSISSAIQACTWVQLRYTTSLIVFYLRTHSHLVSPSIDNSKNTYLLALLNLYAAIFLNWFFSSNSCESHKATSYTPIIQNRSRSIHSNASKSIFNATLKRQLLNRTFE